MVYTFLDGLNIILGLNSLSLQLLFAVLTVVAAVIFSAGGGGKGYLRGLILFPFLNLLCVIVLSLWSMDFTISGTLFFLGLVLMAIGIYISRNDERVLA
jgi:hypothetical protein